MLQSHTHTAWKDQEEEKVKVGGLGGNGLAATSLPLHNMSDHWLMEELA